jgi:hypothetical protein
MKPAMSGGITLNDEENQSSARDFQFEMLIAALFKRAGYGVPLQNLTWSFQRAEVTSA